MMAAAARKCGVYMQANTHCKLVFTRIQWNVYSVSEVSNGSKGNTVVIYNTISLTQSS